MHYKLVKITINIPELAKVIINMFIQYHGFSDSIINDCGSIFISKFWFLLFYFFSIKRQLLTIFNP